MGWMVVLNPDGLLPEISALVKRFTESVRVGRLAVTAEALIPDGRQPDPAAGAEPLAGLLARLIGIPPGLLARLIGIPPT